MQMIIVCMGVYECTECLVYNPLIKKEEQYCFAFKNNYILS